MVGGFRSEKLKKRSWLILREDLAAPAGDSGEDPRAKVTSRVDGVAAVVAHGHADDPDGQADVERVHALLDLHVPRVRDGADDQEQHEGTDDLKIFK